MATLNPSNQFQSWTLTPEEFLQGGLLTTLQKQVIQNQIASVAIEKLHLEYNPAEPLEFVKASSNAQGQIAALSYLLTLSESAEMQLSGQRPLEL